MPRGTDLASQSCNHSPNIMQASCHGKMAIPQAGLSMTTRINASPPARGQNLPRGRLFSDFRRFSLRTESSSVAAHVEQTREPDEEKAHVSDVPPNSDTEKLEAVFRAIEQRKKRLTRMYWMSWKPEPQKETVKRTRKEPVHAGECRC